MSDYSQNVKITLNYHHNVDEDFNPKLSTPVKKKKKTKKTIRQ